MDTRRSILAHLLVRSASLAELGDVTGASLPTVRRAVHELERDRWVRVVGREQATGGRPANRFGIDGGVYAVVGAHLAHPGMRLVATDLSGHGVEASTPPDVGSLDAETVQREVRRFLEHLRVRHPSRRVLGLGVATPGYVDPSSGTIITIGRVPNWDNLPLRQRLHEATGHRATVVNDVDALATAELTAEELDGPAAYVGFAEGVKFSMFLAGSPYAGPFGNAGLVAPKLLAGGEDPDTARLLSVTGLAELHDRHVRDAGGSPERRTPGGRRAVEAILDDAMKGRRPARDLVERMSVVLGMQIAMFVHLVQPTTLILGGALAGAPDGVRARIERETRRRLPTLLDNNLRTRPARVVDVDGTAVGATRVWVQRYLREAAEPLSAVAE